MGSDTKHDTRHTTHNTRHTTFLMDHGFPLLHHSGSTLVSRPHQSIASAWECIGTRHCAFVQHISSPFPPVPWVFLFSVFFSLFSSHGPEGAMHIVYDTRRFATRGAGGFGQLEGFGSRRFHCLLRLGSRLYVSFFVHGLECCMFCFALFWAHGWMLRRLVMSNSCSGSSDDHGHAWTMIGRMEECWRGAAQGLLHGTP